MIRALFLVADSAHAEPLNSAKKALASHGIHLTSHGCGNGKNTASGASVKRWLRQGKSVGRERTSGRIFCLDWDVVLTHQAHMPSVIKHTRCPIIIVERIDGAQLSGGRDYLEHPQVKAMLKSYTFRDPQDHNRYNGRASAHKLQDLGVVGKKTQDAHVGLPEPQLSDEALAKIKLGWGFASHGNLNAYAAREPDFDADRPIDVHFAGTLSYSGSEIETHRRLALNAAQTWPGSTFIGAGRVHPQEKYRDAMYKSKIVLSPWGCGEPCHRDYEALLAGCVLLKPDSGYVRAWPDVFDAKGPGGAYCKPDFSDAHAFVKAIVDNWNVHKHIRKWLRQLILNNRSGEAIAAQVAPVILEAVQ